MNRFDMDADSRKIHIIEALLKVEDEKTLLQIEETIERHTLKPDKMAAEDLFGIWSKDQAEAIEKAIEEGCEQIHPDDWK